MGASPVASQFSFEALHPFESKEQREPALHVLVYVRNGSAAATPESGGWRASKQIGTPDRTRTCDPRLRRPMLYPAELRARG